MLQSYVPYFPAQPRIIVAANRDPASVDAALSEALAAARAHPGSRIWLVRTHVNAVEASAWASALQAEKLGAETVDAAGLSVITVN